jgi:tRNA pseudouridine13 synthase
MYRKFPFKYEDIGIRAKLFKEGTGGYIKEKTEDFIVEEESFEKKRQESGLYTYFTLKKTNWTTMQAIASIARACHVSWKRFSFAGTKDRFGVTKQVICVKGVSPEYLRDIKIKDVEISDTYSSSEPLRLGELHNNRFIVTVREYSSKNIKDALTKFSELVKQGLPNYFGEQRFGLQRPNNHVVGEYILREEYENALKALLSYTTEYEGDESRKARLYLAEHWGDWKEGLAAFPKYLTIERMILSHLVEHKNDYVNALRKIPRNIAKIFVYSFQSYVFNTALSNMVDKGLLEDFEMELPGYDSTLKKMGGSVVEQVLKSEGFSLSDFRVSSYPEISCRGGLRKTMMYPKEFKVLEVSKDSYKISFTLPKAGYATIVLREMIE